MAAVSTAGGLVVIDNIPAAFKGVNCGGTTAGTGPRDGWATSPGEHDLGFTVPWTTLELPAGQFDIAFAHGGTFVRAILALTRRRFLREHRLAFRHLPSR